MNEPVNKVDEAAKKVFMDGVDNQFKQEYGFGLKTLIQFADAVCKVKTERKSFCEERLEYAEKRIDEVEKLKRERDEYKNRYVILKGRIECCGFGEIDDIIKEWDKEDEESN